MTRFFVDRPIVAIVIAILTVILGLVALTGLPIAQYPSIIPPLIQIQTTYTGADALTIEQSVATPLEQQMNGVDKMLYLQSTNASDGTMTLSVTFDVETEVNIDQVNAQNRVAQAQPNLPADVNQYGLTYRSTVGLPLLVFAIYSPKGSYDPSPTCGGPCSSRARSTPRAASGRSRRRPDRSSPTPCDRRGG